MSRCIVCGAELLWRDVAFSKKLLGRGIEEFTCVPCLGAAFGFSAAQMEALEERWRAAGCTLFPPKEET